MAEKKNEKWPQKINEALKILKILGLPRQQQNERSALTLLSLLGLRPADRWNKAKSPMMGITPMMEFFRRNYSKRYAPNTRETVRRQTVHQFIQAGLVVANPDKRRPTNSPNVVYQIEPSALKLLRQWGTTGWAKNLRKHLSAVPTLQRLYARERILKRIPVKRVKNRHIRLSQGRHNELVRNIIDNFCPLFRPKAHVIYVGDTQKKWAYFDSRALEALGVVVKEHGKMPDVVVYCADKKWLVLIEAVTSHGPVEPKRRQELKDLFAGCRAGLVFVTAFNDRKTTKKYIQDISWETEVWIAESPTHLIHFNGKRFLGPYDD